MIRKSYKLLNLETYTPYTIVASTNIVKFFKDIFPFKKNLEIVW